jgi:tRNA threonylcarbamoyladenosine biosynthesis protein TsaE
MSSSLAQTIFTHSEEETLAYGRSLAAKLSVPQCILLTGDLGAGKTTITKGIAEGLHAASKEDVTSPTFTLIHEYRGKNVSIYHIDLYRIETERELQTLGLQDLMNEDSILLIEWGEKFQWVVERCNLQISIESIKETERKITVVSL